MEQKRCTVCSAGQSQGRESKIMEYQTSMIHSVDAFRERFNQVVADRKGGYVLALLTDRVELQRADEERLDRNEMYSKALEIRVFDEDSIYIIELLTEMKRFTLTSLNDCYQWMQSVYTEVIIILLYAINIHYITHIFAF